VADAVTTLGEALLAGSRAGTGRITFHLAGGDVVLDELAVRERSLARAAQLQSWGVERGDIVGVLGRNEPAWVEVAWATWLSGAALVPLPVPVRIRDKRAFAEQLDRLVSQIGCDVVVGDPRLLPHVSPSLARDWSEPLEARAARPSLPHVQPDDVALIACTSGSTAVPKGIPLDHTKMLERYRRFLDANTAGARWVEVDRRLTWHPFFHASGLQLVTEPIVTGKEAHVLPPERFARDPALWLRLLTETEATTTVTSSSACDAAVRAAGPHASGIDLSNLKGVCFSMEMIDPDVVERFVAFGAPRGLDPTVVYSVYGLAEGGVTMTKYGDGIPVDEVDVDVLVRDGRAVPARAGRASKRIASCGRPLEGELRVIGQDGDALPELHVGEIVFRGPRMMDGYVDGATEPVRDGWLHTGDLGYLRDGDLYVTGRSKEVIVQFGRNYHPEDLEWAATRVPRVATGGCVAFAAPDGAEGAAVLAVENTSGADPDELAAEVRAAVVNAVGLDPRDVVVVAEGAIPKAANGKLRRLAARELYARGELTSDRGMRA